MDKSRPNRLLAEVESLRARLAPGQSDDLTLQAFAESLGRLLQADPAPEVLERLGVVSVDTVEVQSAGDSDSVRAMAHAMKIGDEEKLRAALLAQGAPRAVVEQVVLRLRRP
jgi:hypothetical protein